MDGIFIDELLDICNALIILNNVVLVEAQTYY